MSQSSNLSDKETRDEFLKCANYAQTQREEGLKKKLPALGQVLLARVKFELSVCETFYSHLADVFPSIKVFIRFHVRTKCKEQVLESFKWMQLKKFHLDLNEY